ncbi:putative phage abortive infection protein [Iodobacter arcticus]|uniref:Phage abortive infection protein n=1 Tax=Iodobacter arcticus TaxID=590593 RepID=A0ABW2R6L1_9NEIS
MKKCINVLKNWVDSNPQWFVGGIALLLLFSYFYWFGIYSNGEISVSSADWGTLGDFVGGLVNPLVSLFALIWLKKSVDLQNKQMDEIQRNRIEEEKIRALESDALNVRAFEQTFYGLLERFSALSMEVAGNVDEIMSFYYGINDLDLGSLSEFFERKFDDDIGHYFRLLYRVLKFVDQAYPVSDYEFKKRKEYIGILRALISPKATQLLAINCFRPSNNVFDSYRFLLCRYSMLEHLSLKNKDGYHIPMVGAILEYGDEAFGDLHAKIGMDKEIDQYQRNGKKNDDAWGNAYLKFLDNFGD